MPASLKRTISPELALMDMINNPMQEEPNNAIHKTLRTPRKGLLNSFINLDRS